MGFNCELMADPVVASDGRTYERHDIEKWMKTHDVSPLTNAPFVHKFLVENGQSCLYSHPNDGNRQAPLSTFKIKLVLDELLKKYPDYTIKVVTNPNETIDLEYPVIQSEDENYDLYLLSKAPVVVLSRSTFSLSALFFGDHQEVYIPSWGHSVCMGLNTKFDHSNFKYFY